MVQVTILVQRISTKVMHLRRDLDSRYAIGGMPDLQNSQD